MATTPNTLFVAGAILTAQQQNQLPFGAMAAPAKITAAQSGITTEVLVTSASITFTALANRLYKFSWYEPDLDSSGNVSTLFTGRVRLTNLTGTILQESKLAFAGPTTLNDSFHYLEGIYTPAAGSVTLVCTATSTNSLTLQRSATKPAYFIVEDIGTA